MAFYEFIFVNAGEVTPLTNPQELTREEKCPSILVERVQYWLIITLNMTRYHLPSTSYMNLNLCAVRERILDKQSTLPQTPSLVVYHSSKEFHLVSKYIFNTSTQADT